MADTPKMAEVQLQLQLDEAIADGQYCNMALINHAETEFVLDFIFVQPQAPKAKVRSRILLSPQHMKRLLAAMADNVARYEARFGPIVLREEKERAH
ncbi:MAG: DUF3467 domain-containing protein [Myxococcaceae bacterium]|nr:DUF3467 domain-containing protein [Myxococcaceae bacterium]MCI0672807.1 DUF3467 domain-containing protein [Myxococcaceae bacterium]